MAQVPQTHAPQSMPHGICLAGAVLSMCIPDIETPGIDIPGMLCAMECPAMDGLKALSMMLNATTSLMRIRAPLRMREL